MVSQHIIIDFTLAKSYTEAVAICIAVSNNYAKIMKYHGIILMVIGILELILGISFLTKKRIGEAVRWYTLLIFSVSLWVLTNAVAALNDSYVIQHFFIEMTYISGGFIAITFLLFTYNFPSVKKIISPIKTFLLFLPAIINIFIILLTHTYVKGIEIINGSIREDFDFMIYIFSAYFLIFWSWGMWNIIDSYRKADGYHRWLLKYLLVGIAISATLGITADIILPLINVTFPGRNFIGAEFSIVWLGFTSYILYKKA